MKDFKQWWDEDDLITQGNPFTDGTPAYWAWEGWNAGVESEREAIAQMIDNAPALVEYVTNDQGGCLMCGFTPRQAATAIRARGNT